MTLIWCSTVVPIPFVVTIGKGATSLAVTCSNDGHARLMDGLVLVKNVTAYNPGTLGCDKAI